MLTEHQAESKETRSNGSVYWYMSLYLAKDSSPVWDPRKPSARKTWKQDIGQHQGGKKKEATKETKSRH